jgi:hypothetical protein
VRPIEYRVRYDPLVVDERPTEERRMPHGTTQWLVFAGETLFGLAGALFSLWLYSQGY